MPRNRAAALFLLAACAAPALGLYDASDAVVQLTDKDFDKATRSGVWLVEVYAPWCVVAPRAGKPPRGVPISARLSAPDR